MRILHVIHSVNPLGGGPIEGIKQLSTALLPRGISTDVLSLDAPESPGVHDFPLPLFTVGTGRPGYGYSPKAVPWLTEHGGEYDIILVNGLWQYSGFAVWLASQRTRLRYAVFPHGMLDPWFKRRYPLKHLKKWLYWPWGEYRVLRDAEVVFFTSEEERLEARKSFFLYRCNEQVLGYGIAPPPHRKTEQLTLFLKQFPELSGKHLILYLGRIHEKKGCDLLLQAFHEVFSGSGENHGNFHLVIAGPGNDAFSKRMKELSLQLGLESSVSWVGMLSGDLKWGAFHAADAFILPSHQENFGISVVEALACSLPVLISDKINIWREISSDHAGFVEPDDLPGTIRLLRRWAELDLSSKNSLCHQARICFDSRFNVDAVAQRLASLLKR